MSVPAIAKTHVGRVDLTDRYLDLLAKAVTRYGMDSSFRAIEASNRSGVVRRGIGVANRILGKRSLALCRQVPVDYSEREVGRDVPVLAETGIGLKRLTNVRDCIEAVLEEDVPGDLLEAGVWRGGTVIYMCGVLAAHGADRVVWAADSFEGMPEPDLDQYPEDEAMRLHELDSMAVSEAAVREAIDRYGLLSDNVRFLQGWFADTLPTAPIDRLAVLRIDADMYGSTHDALSALYDKVSAGGFVIIDDYGCFDECRRAVDDFRGEHGVTEPMTAVDWTGVFWRKAA
jgi:O-methyltransferase